MLAWIHQALASERELLCQVLSVALPEAVGKWAGGIQRVAWVPVPHWFPHLAAFCSGQEGALATPKPAADKKPQGAGFTEEDR